VNLETAITQSDDFAPGKAIHYRMSPRNVAALAVARPDVCVLANNHVLDFGQAGLDETLRTLDDAGLRVVGAGRDVAAARRPAVVSVEGGGRVVVVAAGTPSSGVPSAWAATGQRAGVDFLPDLTSEHAEELAARIKQVKRPGDIAVASVHWGSNWGFDVPDEHIRFAHVLVDAGVDVVHGHSSHHPRPIEVYRGRLVLYGCGDFIDDYEGIRGYEQFRDDLRVMYLATLEADTGRLSALRMVPMQAHRFTLRRTAEADTEWMREVLDRISRDFGQRVERGPGGSLTLRMGSPEPA
jgi:poly-gamma-glutamate synthesis protein (capsule biosynthesis protein)